MKDLEIDGLMMKDNKGLRQGVEKFFCSLYSEEFSWKPKLDDINFRTLDEISRTSLGRLKKRSLRDSHIIVRIISLVPMVLTWTLYKRSSM